MRPQGSISIWKILQNNYTVIRLALVQKCQNNNLKLLKQISNLKVRLFYRDICSLLLYRQIIKLVYKFLHSLNLMIKKFCSVSLKSNSLLTCLSVCTMCLLIYTTIIIITIISITPIIILGLGEITAGQRDIILSPNNQYNSFLNNTKITEVIGQSAMPRIRYPVTLNQFYANGWFMDFDLEEQNHLGTLPIVPEPNPETHYVYVHQQYGYQVGDKIQINLRSYKILQAIKVSISKCDLQNKEQLLFEINSLIENNVLIGALFEVIGTYQFALGKFAVGQNTGTLYLNISSAFQYMIRQTYTYNNITNTALPQYIDNVNLADYSSETTINIPNRIEIYKNSDYQETFNTLSSFGSEILEKCGLFSVRSEIPIAENLVDMSYFGMFIGVILKLIILSLFCLSVLMMNNMLNVGIERKNFDFAVLKTMGANRIFVIVNLLIDSLKYVVISNIIAFPFSYISLGLVSGVFETFFGYRYDVQPTIFSILGGFLIGVLVPVIASISPIWGVINNDLAENLNPIRNKTQSIKTQIYIEGAQFPLSKLIYGAISSSFGLMIYYLLPKAMINEDISLLLFVFFTILSGLLLGLILISYSFQYLFEKLIAYIVLFWTNKTDFLLTMKNLSAHRIKNRRTSLLYALSVSLVIFVSVGISIQIQTIQQELLKSHGTYIEVHGQIQRKFYDNLFSTSQYKDQILDWAYRTTALNQYLYSNYINNVYVSDQARLFLKNSRIYGVSPNYLKVMPNNDNIPITKSYAYDPYDPYQFLYTPEGYMTTTISEYTAKKMNLLETQNREYLINYYTDIAVERKHLKISTILHKRAGLAYSKFQFGRHEIGISFDTYATLSGLQSFQKMPYQSIKIKVADPENTEALASKLRNTIMTKNNNMVWDYSQVRGTIHNIKSLLDNILSILLILVLMISFFSLVTTSYINIINQKTEIGILMILGYDKIRIYRIFVYEAFVLILNSCLIGVAVGTFVAWMMGLQRQLFGDYPINLQVKGLWIIGIAAIISSFLSTIYPIRNIFKKSINQTLMS